MHKLTKIEIEEKSNQYRKEREAEWGRIILGAVAAGRFPSEAAIEQFIETGYRYVDIILHAVYTTEKAALLKNESLPSDEYFEKLRDELSQFVIEEKDIIIAKALNQFQRMETQSREEVILKTDHRLQEMIKSINNQVEKIKEELKLEISESYQHQQDQPSSDSQGEKGNEARFYNSFWELLHPKVIEISRSRFESGHFADSVEAALKEVNKIVKVIVKEKTGQEFDGAPLMNKAFSLDNPIIRLDDISTETGKNIQKGYIQIFAGTMTGIRNPKAHDNVIIDKQRAIHFLFLASLLMYKLDERLKEVECFLSGGCRSIFRLQGKEAICL